MPQTPPELIAAYVAFTLVFLFLLWLLNSRTRPLGTTLILWGILVVILSCGYALLGVPTMIMVTPALTKIGSLLVLGGLAWSLLASCQPPTAIATPTATATKEVNHV